MQICHSDGEIQLEHVEPSKHGLQLDGILHLSSLYLRANDEQPFGNWQGMIPFTWLLECNNMPENVKYNIAEHVEQLSVNLAGNEEVEIKAVLSFDTFTKIGDCTGNHISSICPIVGRRNRKATGNCRVCSEKRG